MTTNPHQDAAGPPSFSRDGKAKFSPKQLGIVWGKDGRYWRVPDDGPAELLQVCWLEVTGSIGVQKGRRYKISFDVSLKPDAFGWNNCPVYVMAKVGKKGRYSWKKVTLQEPIVSSTQPTIPPPPEILKIEPASDDMLYFGLYEVWSGKWKGGLQIRSATVEEVS